VGAGALGDLLSKARPHTREGALRAALDSSLMIGRLMWSLHLRPMIAWGGICFGMRIRDKERFIDIEKKKDTFTPSPEGTPS